MCIRDRVDRSQIDLLSVRIRLHQFDLSAGENIQVLQRSRGSSVSPNDSRQIGKLESHHLAFVNWDDVYFEIQKFKNEPYAWIVRHCPSTGTMYATPSDPKNTNALEAAKAHRPPWVPKEIPYQWVARS